MKTLVFIFILSLLACCTPQRRSQECPKVVPYHPRYMVQRVSKYGNLYWVHVFNYRNGYRIYTTACLPDSIRAGRWITL